MRKQKAIVKEDILVLILCIYAMRHIMFGIDLGDTGYNFANHQYMGMDHMDPMWLFATYLANVVGHFFTCLPFGHTLIGMNFYTGLIPAALAVGGYFFAVKKLQIPGWLCFLGEFFALNLCWCPTAVLYNYLTFALYFAAIVLLYLGLLNDKNILKILAGVCLGSNILVRFSNLPEAGLILSVWLYAFLCAGEKKKDSSWKNILKSGMQKLCVDTFWCVLGYFSALAVWFGFIGIRYGLTEYITGIRRLFAMTENATDYKSDSMLKGLIRPFIDLSYWILRFGFFIVVALLVWFVAKKLAEYLKKQGKETLAKAVYGIGEGIAGISLAGLVGFLYLRKFTSSSYHSYDPIMRPATLFLFITLVVCGVNLLRKECEKSHKLLSSMIIIITFLTSLGSNNGLMASFNFLFLTAPFVFWELLLFTKWCFRTKKLCPLSVGCWLLIAVIFSHCGMFGAIFVFAESTGIQNPNTKIHGNPVLSGVYMTEKRAAWMEEASEYVNDKTLSGKEVILYGNIPSLSFYFQMPSCFNPWSDLTSYSIEQMEKDMATLEAQIASKEKEKPVIILEHIYHMLLTGQRDVLEAEGENPEYIDYLESNPKWTLIKAFMEKYEYGSEYSNVKIGIWLPDTRSVQFGCINPVISYMYADVDGDGAEEFLTIETLDENQTIETGEPYGNWLRIYENDQTTQKPVYEFDLSYVRPMFLQSGDINGDGKTEIGVIAYKTTEYHPVMSKRPFFYALTDGKLEKVWLGSRLSRPFIDFIVYDLDEDGIEEIISLETTKEGKYVIAMYDWEGFGFDLTCETEAFDALMSFERNQGHVLQKAKIKNFEKCYTISLNENILTLE